MPEMTVEEMRTLILDLAETPLQLHESPDGRPVISQRFRGNGFTVISSIGGPPPDQWLEEESALLRMAYKS